MLYTKADYKSFCDACQAVDANPWDVFRVAYSESGVSTTAWNDNPKNVPPDQRYNASGIIQFMPDTMKGMGFRPDLGPADRAAAFRFLSFAQQCHYMQLYYTPYKGKLVNTAACYVATFLPADLGLAADPEAVLVQKDGRRSWAYTANAAFDANHDYVIQVKELDQAIHRNCSGSRWIVLSSELASYLGESAPVPPVVTGYDLKTTLGLQRAGNKLGFPMGPEDGVPGPLTRAGVVAMQKAFGLVPDGIPGPLTRGAIEKALRAKGYIA